MKPWLLFVLFTLDCQAWALKVAPESVQCQGWYHNRPQSDFAIVDLKPYHIDPLMLMGEIDGIHFSADLHFLPQEGVGLFVYEPASEPASGLRVHSMVGWYRLGNTHHFESNLTVDAPDRNRQGIRFGVRCFTTRPEF